MWGGIAKAESNWFQILLVLEYGSVPAAYKFA